MIPIILKSGSKTAALSYVKKKFPKSYLISLEPEKTEYSVSQIRTIIKECYFQHPQTIVYMMNDFDQSSLEAQNAFLKLLEEPPQNTQFILHVQNENALLETIRSRCKIIKLAHDKTENSKKINLPDWLSYKNNPYLLLNSAEFMVSNKEEGVKAVNKIIRLVRENLTSQVNYGQILGKAIKTKQLMEQNNLNPQLCLDQLLIFIAKTYSMK